MDEFTQCSSHAILGYIVMFVSLCCVLFQLSIYPCNVPGVNKNMLLKSNLLLQEQVKGFSD